MRNLEKLVKEHEAIRAAQERVNKHRMNLTKKLQDHRGALVAIGGEVYRVTRETVPKIEYLGALSL